MKRSIILLMTAIMMTGCTNIEDNSQYIDLVNKYDNLVSEYNILQNELLEISMSKQTLEESNKELNADIMRLNDELESKNEAYISFLPSEKSDYIMYGYVEEITDLKMYPSIDVQTINKVMGYVRIIDSVISGGQEWLLVQLNSPGAFNHYGYISKNKIVERKFEDTLTSDKIGIGGIYIGDTIEKVNHMWGRPVKYSNPEMVSYYTYTYKNGISITVEPNEWKVREIYISVKDVTTNNGLYIGQNVESAKNILSKSYGIFEERENRILYEIENGLVISLRYSDEIITSIWLHKFSNYDG